jgi:hypothetical protein
MSDDTSTARSFAASHHISCRILRPRRHTARATFMEDALPLTLPAIGCNVVRRLAASFVLPKSCGKVRCVVMARDFRATLLMYMGCR